MKFYMHSEEPLLTMVMVWEPEKEGTINEISESFLDNIKKRFPDYSKLNNKVSLIIKNANGKELDKAGDIRKLVKNMDDLFVKIETIKEEPKTEVKEKKTKVEKTPEQREKEKAIREASKGKTNAAEIHLNNGRSRKAIELYEEVLKEDPENKIAIKGMINVYKKADRFVKALDLAKKGLKVYENDVGLLQLLGEMHLGCKDPDAAKECLLKCTKLARSLKSAKTQDKHNILVLLAKAYLLKGERDMAITALQGVLRENMQHVEALIEYAGQIFGLGPSQSEEAINILVTILAQIKENKRAKEKLADLCKQQDGMKMLKSVAGKSMSDPQALMFLGNCLRDYSAITQALELFMLALECSKGDPSAALIIVHTLEIEDKYEIIIEFYEKYCSKYSEKSVGNLSCATLNSIVQNIPSKLKSGSVTALESTEEMVAIQAPKEQYTDDEKYLLAFFFTLVKVLYVKGCLDIVPKLVHLLQPLYDGKDLHATNIRNEAAYFSCISMIYQTYPEIQTTRSAEEQVVYFIGDSHCLPPAWHKITLQDGSYTIYPVLSTGTKIWHLRPEGKFYPKTNFYSAIEQIPDGASVIVCLGEIDCREGLLKCWQKARYDTIEDGIEAVIKIYFRVLRNLQETHHWKIFVHPAPPVLDATRPVVMQFNRILASMLLKKPKFHWLNILPELLIGPDEGVLKKEYRFDGTHIHPKYVSVLAESMAKYA